MHTSTGMFVSYGCGNEPPQTEWFKATKYVVLRFGRSEDLKSKFEWIGVPCGDCRRKSVSLPVLTSSICLYSLAPGSLHLPGQQSCLSNLCFPCCMSFPDTLLLPSLSPCDHMGPSQVIQNHLHLKILNHLCKVLLPWRSHIYKLQGLEGKW